MIQKTVYDVVGSVSVVATFTTLSKAEEFKHKHFGLNLRIQQRQTTFFTWLALKLLFQ